MRFPATRSDFARTLQVLAQLERGCGSDDPAAFARRLFVALDAFVAPEFATLGVCRIDTRRRHAAGPLLLPAPRTRCAGCVHYGHPLGCLRGVAQGLTDAPPAEGIGRGALPVEPLRGLGNARVMAVPVQVEPHRLVRLVLARSRAGFSDRDRARVELLRPHLAFFYRQACGVAPASHGGQRRPAQRDEAPRDAGSGTDGLTQREVQVLQWLAFGKTDAEIGTLLGVSPRTVSKHLEHIYVKLGVETRTAAVMRALHLDPARLRMH